LIFNRECHDFTATGISDYTQFTYKENKYVKNTDLEIPYYGDDKVIVGACYSKLNIQTYKRGGGSMKKMKKSVQNKGHETQKW
jgi:hypothetical protein